MSHTWSGRGTNQLTAHRYPCHHTPIASEILLSSFRCYCRFNDRFPLFQMQHAFLGEASMSENNFMCLCHHISCSFGGTAHVCCRISDTQLARYCCWRGKLFMEHNEYDIDLKDIKGVADQK